MKKKKMITLFIISLFCLASSLQLQNTTLVDAWAYSRNDDFSDFSNIDAANTNATMGNGMLSSPDKKDPELAGFYNSTDDPVDVFVEGDYAFVANYHGDLSIFDVSDPTNLISISNYTIGSGAGTPTGVYVVGSTCYVATRNWGLQIVDVSDPYNPSNFSAYYTYDHPRDVFVDSNYCYVADETGGVQIINVANPSNPIFVANVNYTINQAYGVFVEDNTLYIADYFSRFLVYDVTTPSAPVQLGNVSLTANAYDLSVDGDIAYVADGSAGLVTIDVIVPTTPTIYDTYFSGDYVKDAKFEGKKVYITDSTSGVIVLDVVNPSNIQYIGAYDTWNWPDGLFVKDKMVYVTDYFGGFLVLDHTGYENRVVVQSKVVYTSGSDSLILKASLLLDNYSTLWSGMAIELYMTADNELTWQSVVHGEMTTFTNPGRYLKYRLVFICYNLVNATWVSELTFSLQDEFNAAEKISPSNNEYTADNTTTLSWYSLVNAWNYHLQVDDDGTFLTPVVNVTVFPTTYTTPALPDGTYYWRVSGLEIDGTPGKWSTVWQYTIDTIAPDQTDLMLPVNSSSINDATPQFEWWVTPGADFYQLQVDNNTDFSSLETNVTTSNEIYSLITPLSDGSYYWRVRGYDFAGNLGTWSEIWILNLEVRPDQPILSSPTNDTLTNDNTPFLSAQMVESAVTYQFQVSTDDTFIIASLVLNVNVVSNGYTLTSALADGKYYWRVRAVDNLANWGPWSEVWIFTVDATGPLVTDYASFAYTEGDIGNNITWTITELNSYSYEVLLNDVAVDPGLLTLVGDELSIIVDGLAVGIYNYTVIVTDIAGNFAQDTVIVTVTAIISEFSSLAILVTPVFTIAVCFYIIS